MRGDRGGGVAFHDAATLADGTDQSPRSAADVQRAACPGAGHRTFQGPREYAGCGSALDGRIGKANIANRRVGGGVAEQADITFRFALDGQVVDDVAQAIEGS